MPILFYHNSFYLYSPAIELGKNQVGSYLPFGVGQCYILNKEESEIKEHREGAIITMNMPGKVLNSRAK
jgi:hypothetical protein